MLCSRTRPRPITAVVVVCALGVGLVVGLGGELSLAAHGAVLAAGAVVIAVGLVRRAGAGSPRVAPRRGMWLVVPALALVWEAIALADDDLPTISDLLDPVLAPAPLRATATLAWLALGAWLVIRPGPTVGAAMRTTTGRVLVLLAWMWVGLHFLAR